MSLVYGAGLGVGRNEEGGDRKKKVNLRWIFIRRICQYKGITQNLEPCFHEEQWLETKANTLLKKRSHLISKLHFSCLLESFLEFMSQRTLWT